MRQFTPLEKIQQAKLLIVQHLCFYGSTYWRLQIMEDNSCKTAWTDGTSLGYNVEWLGRWTVPQIVGVFVHEILHVILKHPLREELNQVYKDKHFKFNMACDYALNPTVEAEPNVQLPPGCLVDMDRFPDHLAEYIFTQLTDQEVDKCKAEHGQPDTGGMIGEVRPFKGGTASTAEKDQEANKIDQWVKAAQMKATNAGAFSQHQARIVKTATAPTVNWTDELQMLCEDICKNNYTWQRPNSRYMQQGVYLPTMTGTKQQDMLFFVDTSGSQGEEQLSQIKSEIRMILSSFTMRVIVVYWDTEFEAYEIFEAADVLDPSWELHMKGHGGTNFTNVLDWMDDELPVLDIDPKAVVFFTDLECRNYPDDEPDVPWLWVQLPNILGSFSTRYISCMPDWGRHVQCHEF